MKSAGRLSFFFCFLLLGHCLFARTPAEIAASLDDSTLAAQVLLTGVDGRGSLPQGMRALLERIPAGGVMLFRFNLNTPRADVKNLLSEIDEVINRSSGIPPFISVDHEGGLVHRFGPGVERLPSAYSFWQLAQAEGWDAAFARAETLYRRSAAEIRELGINLVLAPVAETLDEENRVFLVTRSFGPDPDFTEAIASIYIRNMAAEGIASTVKHFPGNSAVDPHYDIAILHADRAALDEMARPFAGIIRNLGPSIIMMSHVVVYAWDSQLPASLSRPIIQDWLRGELGFQGLVMADDFAMDAVAATGLSSAAATVKALNAGVDMIMVWPHELTRVHAAILEALRTGQLRRERLVEAVERIIEVKLRYGIM